MARRDVGAHAMEIGSAAAADVQDRFIAAPMEMGQAPCRKGGMALIHARQHLLPRFPGRSGRIAGRSGASSTFPFSSVR